MPGDYQYPKKYAVVHHLSVNATKWLNVGLFDNVAFGRAIILNFLISIRSSFCLQPNRKTEVRIRPPLDLISKPISVMCPALWAASVQ